MKVVKRFWWVLLVLLLVGVFFFLRSQSERKRLTQAKTAVVEKGTIKDMLTLSGFVNAKEKAKMTFLTGGKLTWVGVKEGDLVTKGQGLASIDGRQAAKQTQKALNLYSITRSQFDQTQYDLSKPSGSSDKDQSNERKLNQSQMGLNNSVLDVEMATIAKETNYLSSPIEGIVTKVDAPYAGMNVGPTQGFSVVNPRTYYISVFADQTEVVKLYKGKEVSITFDAYPDATVKGYIDNISVTPAENSSETVYEVTVLFNKEAYGLKPLLGMSADVSVILSEKEGVLTLPSVFVKTDKIKKERYVWKKDAKGVPQKTIVQVGEQKEGNVEIVSGLAVGDTVLDLQAAP